MKLFDNIVPKTVENYLRLFLGTGTYRGRKLSLIGNSFHRVFPRGYILGGKMDGGNMSIYGPLFADESFDILHRKAGLLTSMSDCNSNSS